MQFTRLRLLGFKSFVEPTDFLIEPGLTGVVGPNGCGKSNLVEALRWVMGENSYKNMRASGMDDVIFSGTNKRPGRNSAEVTLFLADSQDGTGHLPVGHSRQDGGSEVQVSRRITRDAGSVYRINGREARTRDVQLLFADQSTGARSPSMVGQGRVGELIQAKPQARRALLEEAAGIAGLHTRRHEAELRLRAAEQNLDRLDDVIGSLATQIDNLKRQARQALRFKNLSADIRQLEAIQLHLQWIKARTEEALARQELDQATIIVAQSAAQQMEAARDQALGAAKLPGLRDEHASSVANLQMLKLSLQKLDDDEKREMVRLSDLQLRLGQIESDLARESEIEVQNSAILERLGSEEIALKLELEGAMAQTQRSAERVQQAGTQLAQAEHELARENAANAQALADLAKSRQILAAAKERVSRAIGERDRIEREVASFDAQLAQLSGLDLKREAASKAEIDAGQAENDLQSSEKTLGLARESLSSAQAPLAKAKAALARLETEATTLERILASGMGEGFASVLHQIEVQPGFERALAAALGDELDGSLDPDAPARWAGIEFTLPLASLPQGVTCLEYHVKAPERLSRILSQIGIVSGDQGDLLQPQLAPGQVLVNQDGAIWRWDGFQASADAPLASAQRLTQKNRLSELDGQRQSHLAEVRQAEERAQEADLSLQQAIAAEREARQNLRDQAGLLAKAKDALSKTDRISADLEAKRSAFLSSRQHVVQELGEAEKALLNAGQASLSDEQVPARQALLEQAGVLVVAARAKLIELRSEDEGLKRAHATRTARLQAIGIERQEWTSRHQNGQNFQQQLKTREQETRAELDALRQAPSQFSDQRHDLQAQAKSAEDLLAGNASSLNAAEVAQKELDQAATKSIENLSGSREARGRAEERFISCEDRLQVLAQRIRETLSCKPDKILSHANIGADEKLPAAEEVEHRLARLRQEREKLGAVNLRADEEQEELVTQHDKIIADRADIIDAVRTLRQAIHELNRDGRERLLQAFERVNEEFQRLFVHLFNGGTATLQLIESDDPLQAGLDILARPPGKKPQTMSLLSGGEQALTAMALIFAVFLTNPAPVCVLDEVDAPLDDHNVERFCNLMDMMAASTQTRFIIITHNPVTMARMNRLFGVTMVEQGVSQLVSVDLDVAAKLVEEA